MKSDIYSCVSVCSDDASTVTMSPRGGATGHSDLQTALASVESQLQQLVLMHSVTHASAANVRSTGVVTNCTRPL